MFILWIKIYFSDGACRHVGASVINLEETLWEQWGYMHWVKVYVEKERKSTWGGDTCRKHGFYQAHQWKKKKKSTCKPKSTIFDPRPSYMGQPNPALEICTPILHGMAEPQVEEAAEGQENLVSDHVYSDTRTPQHEPYSTENLSP